MRVVKRFLVVIFVLLMGTLTISNEVKAEDIIGNGITGAEGDNLIWTVDSAGVLTISGTGAMKDEGFTYERPWSEFADRINKIIIEEGVTTVGVRSFWKMNTISCVEMADTVERIGKEAFAECPNLTDVKFPNSRLVIDENAFMSCKGLERVELPEKLKKVESDAFWFCRGLKIVIWKGDDVEIVGYPFDNCHLDLVFYSLHEGKVKEYADREWIDFKYIPELRAEELYIDPDLGQTYATLTWKTPGLSDGYRIYKYDSADKEYKLIKTLSGDAAKYKVSGLKSGTLYKYKVCTFALIDGEEYKGEESQISFRTLSTSKAIAAKNDKISDGFVGAVKTTAKKRTELSAATNGGYHERWAPVSDLSQFVDNKGNYCIAYSDKNNKYVYIRAYDKDLEQVYSRKIKQLYPLLGGVECDEEGNFFVVWGKQDTNSSPGAATMAISKYKKNGDFVKTTKFKTQYLNDTKIPFDAGNCDIAILDNLLICNYAREMYNGHQSNGLLQLDTKTMKEIDIYETYSSHSFDQRVMFDRDGIAWFASHGDAIPRAFSVDTSGGGKEKSFEPFHFYVVEENMDNMQIVNVTRARLGGVIETSSGLVLSGSSVKSMKASGYNSQEKNLFIMYADPERKMPGGTSRSGICNGKNVTDTGVKWLTNNSKAGIDNVQMVYTDDDRIILMWETFKDTGYSNTWYMILSSNGNVLQKAAKLRNVRLNANEDPIYKDGYIYWSTCNSFIDDEKLKNHRLSLKMLTYDKDKLAVKNLKATKTSKKITLNWKKNSTADGFIVYKYSGDAYKKVKTVKSNKYTVSGLKANTNYKLAVKAYKKIDGKTYYGAMKYLKVKTSKSH